MDYKPKELAENELTAYLRAEHIGFRLVHDTVDILDWSELTYNTFAALDDKVCEINEKYGTEWDIY